MARTLASWSAKLSDFKHHTTSCPISNGGLKWAGDETRRCRALTQTWTHFKNGSADPLPLNESRPPFNPHFDAQTDTVGSVHVNLTNAYIIYTLLQIALHMTVCACIFHTNLYQNGFVSMSCLILESDIFAGTSLIS